MEMAIGLFVTLVSLLCWGGQVLVCLAPGMATRLGFLEPKEEVDPAFYADALGEARWDACVLWVLTAAGILMLQHSGLWNYFGLVGGAMYLYFSGRSILSRLSLRRHGIRHGNPKMLKAYYWFLILWGLTGAGMVVFSLVSLKF